MHKPLLTVAFEQKLYQQTSTKEPREIVASIEALLANRETLDACSGLRALDYLDILRDKLVALLKEMLNKRLALHQESAWTDPLNEHYGNVTNHIRVLIIRSTAFDNQTSVVLCDILSTSSGPIVLQDQDDSGILIGYSLANVSSLMEQMQRMCAASYAFANPTRPLPHQQQAKKGTKQWIPSLRMFTRSLAIERSLKQA